MKDKILNITLIFGVILGIFLHDTLLSTIAMLAGFFNVYFTSRKSKYFIIPDLIWIICSVFLLFNTKNYTDLPLYIFYFFVAFIQFYQWSKNEDDKNEAKLLKINNKKFGIIVIILLLVVGILLPLSPNGNNKLVGLIISVFGIVASVLLAFRYYDSQYLFFVTNTLQIYLYINSGLYQLALIPLVFLINSVVFIIYNKPTKN